jgi:tetratricopeptide (TPR) repeat protein
VGKVLPGVRIVAAAAPVLLAAAASFVIHADTAPASEAAEIQMQLGNLLNGEGRYLDALDAYQKALKKAEPGTERRARAGVVQMALRVAEFDLARREAETLVKDHPGSAETMSLYGDALWAAGLFEQAEIKYHDALAAQPELARGHHGLARSFAARSRLDDAMNEAQAALRLSPRDLEIHHTVGTIYERMHKYEEAAGAYTNFVNLLPNKDHSEKADWSRAEIRFLRSFGQRVPFEMDPGADERLYTVDFKLVNEKVVVRAKVNDAAAQDFVVDTGSENTVITRTTAQRLSVTPVTYTLSAGVGEVGLRGLQLARIDSLEVGALKLRNVPCLIKNPPLRDMPTKETESLSPLALGFSMTIDYKTHKLTFGRHLPAEPKDFELPLRLYRLATVRGTVDGVHQVNFVVDTGGEVISISQATATALGKQQPANRIALKVYGTSGWDREAFLLPGIDLAFDAIQYKNFPVVVLNLNAPSALLGFQLGGIVGHKFLSKYRVGIDLEQSVLRLKAVS